MSLKIILTKKSTLFIGEAYSIVGYKVVDGKPVFFEIFRTEECLIDNVKNRFFILKTGPS